MQKNTLLHKIKGKVDRPVRYPCDNFVHGRTLLGDGDLTAQTFRWLQYMENVRVHGTTRSQFPNEFAVVTSVMILFRSLVCLIQTEAIEYAIRSERRRPATKDHSKR